ncbi:MAG: tRNA (adenosine(37)-N6)-threonylcarbamoyltransferase complex ATPase subunit type 1 TsaE [Desulfamplus sp.]|nr:tRNA (adenosine(37)-N6)-threonylcarbamoyltransferase complex ATPase subunit type 1 TsaE [Desulfamplus sp.]
MCSKIITKNGHSTKELGRKLGSLIADNLNSGNISSNNIAIAMYGDLGAGKTTFIQGFGRGLGVSEEYYITSPTYNIINEYPVYLSDSYKSSNTIPKIKLTLYHIDLYRIGSPDELEYIGFDDVASSDNCVIIIEWPDIISLYNKKILKFDIDVTIKIDKDFNRDISLTAYGLESINLLKQVA